MLILNLRSSLLGLGVLILAGLFWPGFAEAQAVRCVDAQGNVSYRDASGQTGGACTPLNQQALRSPRGESRDSVTGQVAPTDQRQLCIGTLASSLFAPNTARFTLSPSGPSVLAGYVDAQNRAGAYVRREVWCEFSASGTLQHAYVDQDPAVLRENITAR
jgi:hypothetical protein